MVLIHRLVPISADNPGDAASPGREHILAILPYPEDKKVVAALEEKHNCTVDWRDITFPESSFATGIDKPESYIPDDVWTKATILITLINFPARPELAKNLKLVQTFSAGVNQLIGRPLWTDTDVPITNSSGIHAPQIAEWVILQILSHAHKEKLMLKWQKAHYWGPHNAVGEVRDAIGQRVGILGYGAIGRQVGRVLQSLGMDVIAYTASPRPTPESRRDTGKYIVPSTGDPDGTIPSAWYSGLSKAALHTFLSQDIDILLVAVPLTPETTHFLAAPEFRILAARNAFIVNIARGAIIDQDALIASLKSGELRGAALDVTDPEPLPVDSELWDLENVTVTPHVSGLGTMYTERSFAILDQNLTNLEEGRPLINEVSRRKGY